MKKVITIGVAGGSGSGKTTFARRLWQAFIQEMGAASAAILAQDHYYFDQSAKFRADGDPSVNFDHPSSIDFALIRDHLIQLKNGKAVEVPIYDFVTHTRLAKTTPFQAHSVVIVDGMLLFSQEIVLPQLDFRIFVDAPEEVRYNRRLERDVRERGRTQEGVRKQFFAQVKPMHDEFIEPSKTGADEVVSGLVPFEPVIEKWVTKIRQALAHSS